jgi:nucleotide-binding universal stress UspA family protein
MMKTILVELTGSQTDDAVLESAYLAARLFDARLECLHVAPNWHQIAARSAIAEMGGPVVPEDLLGAFEAEAKGLIWRAHRHFSEFCKRRNVSQSEAPSGSHGLSAVWQGIPDESGHELLTWARFHDLTVMARHHDVGALGAFILKAGRPVLLAPQPAPENFAPTIVIAWKDRPESARAVMAAMPLLAKADQIIAVCVEDGLGKAATIASAERLARQLRWHGLNLRTHYLPDPDEDVADAIVKFAQDSKADLIVSGAYGHSRLSEFVLGGVTRDLLKECPLPLFLFH